jgi:hypothetical protein
MILSEKLDFVGFKGNLLTLVNLNFPDSDIAVCRKQTGLE